MDPVIVAVVTAALTQIIALVGVPWSLGGRIARIEEGQKALVSFRELSARCADCDSRFERREISVVQAYPRREPGGA